MLYDYQQYAAGIATNDPNVIVFTIDVANNYVNTATPILTTDVTIGSPAYYSVLVDNTNFTTATWSSYASTNIVASLGSLQGWHQLWVGLKGPSPGATVTWVWKRLKLDFTPPKIVVTNPATSTVDVPMIQVSGYSTEDLAYISCAVSNASGIVSNLDSGVTSRLYNTNNWEFTTNYFECLDVPLTNGLNTVIIQSADLAGNVTTTNFNFTVDYSSKTNPPIVQITAPLDGMMLAGNCFTLRGQVNDPTVTITASITDTNGNVNTIDGLVERNGRFWLEGVPLSGGTNALSIVVSDVVSNTTVTNISLVQSPLTLTITPQSDDSQLWQPTVNVIGTISDASYAVWVNGVAGTNNGDGTWAANNVPTTPGGVAIFDVTAYPPGEAPSGSLSGTGVNPQTADSVNTTSDPDKPPRLYMDYYTESDAGSIVDTGPGGYYYTADINAFYAWSQTNGGNGMQINDLNITAANGWESLQGNCFLSSPPSEWPLIATGTNNTYTYYDEDVDDIPFSSSESETNYWTPLCINEHCVAQAAISANHLGVMFTFGSWGWEFPNTLSGGYNRTADAFWKLQTGGKAISNRQNLFQLTASATQMLDPLTEPVFGSQEQPTADDGTGGILRWVSSNQPGPTSKPVPSQNITIDGLPLGNDGNLWRTYSDNITRDVTPKVSGVDFYTFTISPPQKYHPYITAGSGFAWGNLDYAVPRFCVGEQVTFTFNGLPDYANYLAHWSLPQKYVNEQWQHQKLINVPGTGESYLESYGSINYRVNTDLLTNLPSTSCWFVNGSGGRISVGAYLYFANGQQVFVSSYGNISVYRPTGSIVSRFAYGTPTVEWHDAWTYLSSSGNLKVGAGVNSPRSMDFLGGVQSKYPGQVKWIQIADLDFTGTGFLDGAPIINPNVSGVLDNQDPFGPICGIVANVVPNPAKNWNTVPLDDSPQAASFGTINPIIRLNCTLHDYLMFQPSDGGIWVSLGQTSWSTQSGATWPSTVIVPSNAVSGPGNLDGSDNFPEWTSVFGNP